MPKKGNPFVKLLARDLIALLGAHNLNDSYEIGRTPLSPEKFEVHDDWNPNHENFDADIAIIRFQIGTITFSTNVQPICMWNEKFDPIQTDGYTAGWGQSENLEKKFEEIPTKLRIPIHENFNCLLTTIELADLASNRTFCAGKGDGTGTCTGDSGGGVSIKVGPFFYFRGIVSAGLWDGMSCDAFKYSIFTDVLKFTPWIDRIMREDGEILIQKVVRDNLRCTLEKSSRSKLKMRYANLKTCSINDQKFVGEGFSIANDVDPSVEAFLISDNKEVKFLPERLDKFFPGLIAYEIKNCLIRTVTEKHFKDLYKLEYLDLSNNEIDSIDRDSFKDLKNLEFLKLSSNKIRTIDPNLFKSLEALWQLRIGGNQIKLLDEKMFNILRNIREISLDNNKIVTVPANLLQQNFKLEEIRLGGNKIQTISSTMFDHLYNLNYVGLKKNVCVNDLFLFSQFNEMKVLLKMNCGSPI